MSTIRDEMGLTYGIHSRLVGITPEYDGHWTVGVTLSQENVEKGIAATLDEVRRFVDEGPTADELESKQATITGSFKVGLATTRQLAAILHRYAVQGFGMDYLERFPREIEAVTLGQIRAALHRRRDALCRPDRQNQNDRNAVCRALAPQNALRDRNPGRCVPRTRVDFIYPPARSFGGGALTGRSQPCAGSQESAISTASRWRPHCCNG